jgi:hypothetical protein
MNDLLLKATLATWLFSLLSVALIFVCLERLIRQSGELARIRAEAQDEPVEHPLHPVHAARDSLATLGPTERDRLVEEVCFHFFEPRIRHGEFLRNVALSGSFALNLVGFVTATGEGDPGQMMQHVAPYFVFSLIGIVLSILESWLLGRLAAAHQESLYYGERYAAYVAAVHSSPSTS